MTASVAPGEWLVIVAIDHGRAVAAEIVEATRDADELSRSWTGPTGGSCCASPDRMPRPCCPKVCAVDLDDAVTPDGTALRTSVAAVVTDIVRDDAGGQRSYLLGCEWSSGQYLHDAVLEAGAEFGIDVEGFDPADATRHWLAPPPTR